MDDGEESGWTTYLQDFSVENIQRENEYDDDDDDSLVSDAASHQAAWKKKNNNNNSSSCPYYSLGGSQVLKRLNFKKPTVRSNGKLSDPDLEDTASSPVNSPKVSSLKQMENNYRRPETNSGNCMEKGVDFEDYQEMQADGRRINFDEKSNEENIDLKKRGLCVMPLSLFMNYSNNNNNNDN